MNLDWVDSFRVFAVYLNFTHAARELGLSQPALFTQVKKLSESLGKKLYLKKGGALILTEDGERLARFARELHERVAAFEQEISDASGESGVRLAADDLCWRYLLDWIQGSGDPPITPVVLPAGLDASAAVTQQVRDGRAHLGLAALDDAPEDLTVAAVADVSAVLVMRRDHRLAQVPRVLPVDLEGETLVAAPSGDRTQTMFERVLAAPGVSMGVSAVCGDIHTRLHLVARGFGLCLVPDFVNLPQDLTARLFPSLGPQRYLLLRRPEAEADAAPARLAGAVLDNAAYWERHPDCARLAAWPSPQDDF